MKKIYLGLVITGLLAGCANTADTTSNVASTTNSVTAVATGSNLIIDPQLTQFRSNSGKSDVWKKQANKNKGLGDAGSSKDTAFGKEGSSRLRFMEATDDFTAQPGLSQEVFGLQPNTDYEFSLYYNDKKGDESPTELVFGVTSASGQSLATKTVHTSELNNAPKGAVRDSFRQTFVSFNSGANVSVTVYAKLHIADLSKIDMDGDVAKQTEVRIDEFKLAQK
ncbi:hypothetical protein [uncultured Psychromonas sp.]|uniref:hypothetical protein n=1 Tax=uncultured Psychromonas sp. TaxID=173974 RepID=UPI00261DCAC5|nr:hypothetical protein [uncultured Psychromonas sp.]